MPSLEFKGKQFVYAHHLGVPFRTLDIDEAKSCPAPGGTPSLDDNLIIHGDNLHALKALLPTYAGKIKCVYIDPPYNTGEEGWCYNDNVRSPQMQEWLKKSANPVDKDDLERHDKWLCMMWPRLHLLRDLLRTDGLLIVSIDDIEVHRLRQLLDSVFTEDCFLGQLVWRSRNYTDSRSLTGISHDHEYLLVYTRTPGGASFKGRERDLGKFTNPDDDRRGPWMSRSILGLASKEARPNLHYDLVDPDTGLVYPPAPDTGWRYSTDTMAKKISQDRILWPSQPDGRPREKVFLQDLKNRLTTFGSIVEGVHTADGSGEIRAIFGGQAFPFPKPSRLLEVLLDQVLEPDDVVLDSFAGSGTTAHAVLALNRQDDGNRRFILVECEDYAGSLTAERVRRVINGYEFEGTQKEELYSLKLTPTVLPKMPDHLQAIDGIKQMDEGRFDGIKQTVKDNTLTVYGQKKVSERAEGLGGSFTFCELGREINLENLLRSEDLPSYEALARYVFHTATGQTLHGAVEERENGWLGETTAYDVFLLYRPDREWLRSNEAILDRSKAHQIAAWGVGRRRKLVFAAAKFVSQKELTTMGVEFCQLPYAIYRVLGE